MLRVPMRMDLPAGIMGLAHLFSCAGFELYVVGGAVRDFVMHAKPKDYDLATNATPDQVIKLLKDSSCWSSDLTGKAFGVVRAQSLVDDAAGEYEIATFREDLSVGRHPKVRFATIKEDVQRRDLTINALFYDIANSEIVDLVGGLEDIAQRVIRTVGKPEDRFAEDRLRILRAIRFSGRLGFSMHPETFAAIAHDNNLDGVSWERIHDEVVKGISTCGDRMRFTITMLELDMWKRALPGLKISPLAQCAKSWRVPVVLALLLDDEDPATLGSKLDYLKYTADEISQVGFLLDFRMFDAKHAHQIRKNFQRSKLQHLELIEHCFLSDKGPDCSMLQVFRAYVSHPPVKGDDLLAQGYSGPALGRELEKRENEIFKSLVSRSSKS